MQVGVESGVCRLATRAYATIVGALAVPVRALCRLGGGAHWFRRRAGALHVRVEARAVLFAKEVATSRLQTVQSEIAGRVECALRCGSLAGRIEHATAIGNVPIQERKKERKLERLGETGIVSRRPRQQGGSVIKLPRLALALRSHASAGARQADGATASLTRINFAQIT